MTRSRARRATQDHEGEEFETSQLEKIHTEFDEEDVDNYEEFTDEDDNAQPVEIRIPATSTLPPNEADHEANTDAQPFESNSNQDLIGEHQY